MHKMHGMLLLYMHGCVVIGTLTAVLVVLVATLIPALLSFSFSSFLTWMVSVEVNKYC